MNTEVKFKYKTRKLPCRKASYQIGQQIGGHSIRRLLSMDVQKTVFLLDGQRVLCIRHRDRRLPAELCAALRRPTAGLVEVLSVGTLEGDWYTIDRALDPLPDWNTMSQGRRRQVVEQMADCIDSLHSLGYCHLDIKPEHFGLDTDCGVRLMDPDSALAYTGTECSAGSEIEYTPGYAPAEVLDRRYSTASDYYCLGKTIQVMMHGDRDPFWTDLVQKLTCGDISVRMNHTQLRQALRGQTVEEATGPRSYHSGKTVGIHTAYSDKQLALYLSRSYEAACAYTAALPHRLGESECARVARVIHELDPAAPLVWYGTSYPSTREIGAAMSARYPQQDERMRELLASGVLLQFREVREADLSVRELLGRARQNPQNCYWEVSRCFGGRYVEQQRLPSLSSLPAKLNTVNELLAQVVRSADPVTAARVLVSIGEKPTSRTIDGVIAQLRAIPLGDWNNLTNITSQEVFGQFIETQLPEPGSVEEPRQISELIPAGTYYIVDERQYQDWISRNRQIRNARRERNVAILKIIGWVALGAILLMLLPYILVIAIIIGIIALIFS